MGGETRRDPGDRLQGWGSRTCHLQALQLSQAQEGPRMHRADDIVPQVPVGGKWEYSHLSQTGPHTFPPRWGSFIFTRSELDFLLNLCSAGWEVG